MNAPAADQIVTMLRRELAKHMDVDEVVASFGQVEASKRREAGEVFSLRDHARGLILAMLSANRPWRPIATNMGRLAEVFGDYRPGFLRSADPNTLSDGVKRLRCGNTRITFQMKSIRPNLERLERIEMDHSSLDRFLESQAPEQIAAVLGSTGSRYKLAELGVPLALEYLKNVGIRAAKTDVHVMRICGPERLGILSSSSPVGAAREFAAFAGAAGAHVVELDNLIWLFGASEYAAVCGAEPRCAACELRSACRWPTRSRQ